MKKIFYSLIIFVSLFACVLLLSNRVNSSNAENLICSAETIPTTQNVNFYGSDNETLLYTAQVPYGSTLNSVKSKNLFDVSKMGVSFDLATSSITFITNSFGHRDFGPLKKFVNLEAGKTYFLNFSDPYGLSKDIYLFGSASVWTAQRSKTITQSDLDDSIRFYGGPNTEYTVSLLMVSYGTNLLDFDPYYDDLNEYVNEQYLNSAGVSDLSTPVSWSTSIESNNMFPFNVPITQDYNLYGYINDGEIITYEGELTSRVSDIGNYALTDIVSLNIDGYYLYRYDLYIDEVVDYAFSFYDSSLLEYPALSGYTNCFYFNSNSDYFDLNILVCSSDNLYEVGSSQFNYKFNRSTNFTYIDFSFDSSCVGKTYYIYFSNLAFNLDNSNTWSLDTDYSSIYSKPTSYMLTENLGYLVDMNSDTNFNYNLLSKNNRSPFYDHNSSSYFSYIIMSNLFSWYDNSSIYGNELKFNVGSNVYSYSIDRIYRVYSLTSSIVDKNINFYVNDYYFIVDKPTYRVNNALLLYNFDYYNTLYNVNKVVYELSKNGNYYDIVYNGTLPNYKYMYIDNEQINNTIFDRYIFVHFTFNNNNVLNLFDNGEYVPYYVGFDFNFAYYVEPLISDSSTFEYDFDKPSYKETGNIFNINWLAVAYNIIVFLAFYMPLVSHVFEMLGLNYFFGGLLNVISFIFDNPLGNFLLGCLAFIIFFKLILWFWPIAWEVNKQAFNTIKEYHSVNKDYKNDLKRQKRWNDRKLKFRHYGNLKASQRRKLSQVYFTRNYRKSVDTRNFHSLHGKHYGHLKYSQIKGRKNYFNKKPVFIGTKKKSK